LKDKILPVNHWRFIPTLILRIERGASRQPAKFKNKNRFRSFVFPQLGKDCLLQGRVKLPSIGIVKIRQSREYPTGFTPKQFRIVRRASGYYLMITFSSNESVPDPVPGKTSIGLDAGIESFIATPTELIKSPKFLLEKARKLKLLQRRFKKKTKGAKNWLRLQNKVAKTHEQVANTRRDWHFKLAHQICMKADKIFVEDINFNSWSKGLFCKQSLDSGIGGFINEILPFVAWKQGKYYLKVDKNFTSQECPKCQQRTGKKSLNQRVHSCHFCGHTESRDTASAKIIMQRGQLAVGHTVFKNACGDVLAGVEQGILFNLVKSRRTKNLPLQLENVVQTLD
jgi:putative transposase